MKRDTREDAKLCNRDSGQVLPDVLSSSATEAARYLGTLCQSLNVAGD